MKKTFKSILAMILCAMIAITGIGTETAYAANSKTPIKVTFNKKTVTLSKDINDSVKPLNLKTLNKKWGKPKKTEQETRTEYTWKKGKTTINYYVSKTPKAERTGCERTYIRIDSYDANGGAFGIKVGMKRSKAEKILKNLDLEIRDTDAGGYLSSDMGIFSCTFKNGKVTGVTCEITITD